MSHPMSSVEFPGHCRQETASSKTGRRVRVLRRARRLRSLLRRRAPAVAAAAVATATQHRASYPRASLSNTSHHHHHHLHHHFRHHRRPCSRRFRALRRKCRVVSRALVMLPHAPAAPYALAHPAPPTRSRSCA